MLLLLLLVCAARVCVQRRIVAQNIKRLKDIGCYRGRRHIMVRHTERHTCVTQQHVLAECIAVHVAARAAALTHAY